MCNHHKWKMFSHQSYSHRFDIFPYIGKILIVWLQMMGFWKQLMATLERVLNKSVKTRTSRETWSTRNGEEKNTKENKKIGERVENAKIISHVTFLMDQSKKKLDSQKMFLVFAPFLSNLYLFSLIIFGYFVAKYL